MNATTVNYEDFESWEEFESRLRDISADRDALAAQSKPLHVSPLLFRGQESHEWALATTLERVGRQPWSFGRYFHLISIVRPQIETFTGKRWDIPDHDELMDWSINYDNFWREFPAYDYLVYLRHHGFPSPLLDWTRSPYVAAYFAFAKPSSDRVAIHAYMEYAGGGKSTVGSEARIRTLGPFVRSHARHFVQQSEYSFASRFHNERWVVEPHESVFGSARRDQDQLWKFTLPSSERDKVLRVLDAYNLNAFSLFQSEEALLTTLAVKEIELNGM